jgi:hypothetical protein
MNLNFHSPYVSLHWELLSSMVCLVGCEATLTHGSSSLLATPLIYFMFECCISSSFLTSFSIFHPRTDLNLPLDLLDVVQIECNATRKRH